MAITGLNPAGIPKIQNEINTWVKEIKAVDTVATTKQIANAVRGSKREAEIKALCMSMTSLVANLTNLLTTYNNRLNEVKQNYIKNDTAGSQAIASVTAAVKNMKS